VFHVINIVTIYRNELNFYQFWWLNLFLAVVLGGL